MTLLAQKRPVIFAGENHMITLFAPNGDQAIASLSCWRCTYSAHGEGFVLFVWSDPPAADHLAANAIYSDNALMARLVATHFNQYFAGFEQRGFAERAIQHARFSQQGDAQRSHRIVCTSDEQTIELLWRDTFDAAQEIFYNTSGPIPYDVSAVICPCRQATVVVNGQQVAGEVRVPSGASASSAFLAFSETWVRADQQA